VGRFTRRAGRAIAGPATRLAYSTDGAPPAPRAAETAERREGGGKGVRLRLETRASGRAVTLVLGIPGGEAEWAEVAAVLKTACGAGGSVRDGVIELQGDQREKARAVLASRGLKAR
jgi:translation initiation factor 1